MAAIDAASAILVAMPPVVSCAATAVCTASVKPTHVNTNYIKTLSNLVIAMEQALKKGSQSQEIPTVFTKIPEPLFSPKGGSTIVQLQSSNTTATQQQQYKFVVDFQWWAPDIPDLIKITRCCIRRFGNMIRIRD